MRKYLPFVIIAAVVAVAVIAGLLFLRSRRNTELFTTDQPAQLAQPAPGEKGPEAAAISVTLEEFADYQCPPCGALHPELKKIKQDYGTRLNFVFRNLPLSSVHKNAYAAAQAAEAARLQDRFWEMHDLLYENQSEWKDDVNLFPIFHRYARRIGIDPNRFFRDMEGPEVRRRISDDAVHAQALGITSTPTILIEGRQLKADITTPEGIRRGIDFMLNRKQTQ